MGYRQRDAFQPYGKVVLSNTYTQSCKLMSRLVTISQDILNSSINKIHLKSKLHITNQNAYGGEVIVGGVHGVLQVDAICFENHPTHAQLICNLDSVGESAAFSMQGII